MNIFEHETQYSVHLCEHTDEATYACFKDVLKELAAEQIETMRVLEIGWARMCINGKIVTIQEETYVGVHLFGPQAIVDDLMKRVHYKMQGRKSS